MKAFALGLIGIICLGLVFTDSAVVGSRARKKVQGGYTAEPMHTSDSESVCEACGLVFITGRGQIVPSINLSYDPVKVYFHYYCSRDKQPYTHIIVAGYHIDHLRGVVVKCTEENHEFYK